MNLTKTMGLLFVLFFSFNTKAQTVYPPLSALVEVNDTQDIGHLNFLDSLDSKIRVFLSGENHTYVYYNNEVEIQLLKYMYNKKGVRNLVIELGYARGYMLDKFINEDSSAIDIISYQTSYQYLEFYRSLREYNQSLPDTDRLHVYGVDVERFSQDGNMLLHYLLHKKDSVKVPENIEFFVESVRAYNSVPEYTFKDYYYTEENINSETETKIVDTLIAQYNRQKNEINQYLAGDSIVFEKTIQSLIDFQVYQSYNLMPQQYLYRERYLKKQMQMLLDRDTTSRYYGQFGRCHVGLKQFENECQWWENSPMASRLNDTKYKNQVYSIGLFYKTNKYEFENQFMDYDVTDYINHLFDSLKVDKHYLYPLGKNDTLLNKHFNAIILVNSDMNDYYTNYDGSYDFFSFDINAGQAMFNLNNFNQAVFGSTGNRFNSEMKMLNFSYMVSTGHFVQTGEFSMYIPQTIKQGNFKYTLGGSAFHFGYGYDPHIGKSFNVLPYALFGYSRLNYVAQNDSLKQSFSSGFSGVDRQKFINPAFTLGGGASMKINFTNWFGVNFKGFVLADVSDKKWRMKSSGINPIDEVSPKTSLLNYGFSAGISLLIRYY